ncbi:thiamine-phosphate kinase [Halomonas piscis]|uniref:Thiamine-monophosphate kinase n=1 Tax=Halomonas piscis TaxID=3031727 RepID=A0ABY9Z2I4_9GAMM|nr:thiamine-phosphate kinase [Halomonas piscis]WNK21247.1 thiamine-phosphate kinase [Halomonas piscis]
MLAEFDLIRRYFTPGGTAGAESRGMTLGVGDDASLLLPRSGHELAVSVDTSVVDVHFPGDAPARALGHRALAVAVSDLAAMGARGRFCWMALTLDAQRLADEHAAEAWLAGYARGFMDGCARWETALAGGDVTSGRLAISVTVMGEVPAGQALRRSGARVGDVVAVTGALGGGAGGLELWQRGERDLDHPLLRRYLLPEPALEAGMALRGLASSAMDISDGLLADLGHIRCASGVDAVLKVDALPLADGLGAALGADEARRAALSGGDDYELLVTLPPANLARAQQALEAAGIALTAIGRCVAPGEGQNAAEILETATGGRRGWQHFTSPDPAPTEPPR